MLWLSIWTVAKYCENNNDDDNDNGGMTINIDDDDDDDDDDSYNWLLKQYKVQRNEFLTSCLIYTVCEVLSVLWWDHSLTYLPFVSSIEWSVYYCYCYKCCVRKIDWLLCCNLLNTVFYLCNCLVIVCDVWLAIIIAVIKWWSIQSTTLGNKTIICVC